MPSAPIHITFQHSFGHFSILHLLCVSEPWYVCLIVTPVTTTDSNCLLLISLKQEKKDWQDGESQEAQLFEKISVKHEFNLQPNQTDLALHTSPYFSHIGLGSQFDLVNQQPSRANGNVEWKLEAGQLLGNVADRGSPQQENAPVRKPKKRGRKQKVKEEEK